MLQEEYIIPRSKSGISTDGNIRITFSDQIEEKEFEPLVDLFAPGHGKDAKLRNVLPEGDSLDNDDNGGTTTLETQQTLKAME